MAPTSSAVNGGRVATIAASPCGSLEEQLAHLVAARRQHCAAGGCGRAPYGRHRARVATALGRTESGLWPEVAVEPERDDLRREIVGVFTYANDVCALDCRALLQTPRRLLLNATIRLIRSNLSTSPLTTT